MTFSPRAKSSSTRNMALASETCSSPSPSVTVKGYILAANSVRVIQGDFPPADPYIYCQNDPNYTGHASTAVTLSMRVSSGSDSGTLEIGWKKERLGGATAMLKKIFITAGVRSDPASLLAMDVADMPATNFNLKILRDCSTGTPAFQLNGTNVTPAVGTGKNQIKPTVWALLKQMSPTHIKTIVELHDNRSHAPGTATARYVVLNCEYQTCSIIHPWINALGDVQIDPGSAVEVKINKPDGETFECWDTRN